MNSKEVDLSRVAVIIPARDEEAVLPSLLGRLAQQGVERVVVVDNGSTDGTGEAARAGGAHVVGEPQKGYGRACLAGIRYLEEGLGIGTPPPPDVVLFMDGDGSDDPEDLHALLGPVFAAEADMTVGVRRPSGGGQGIGGAEAPGEPGELRARLGTGFILWLARHLHGLEARDLGPFRALKWTLLQRMSMDDETWGWTLQMQLRARHLGARVKEVELPRGRRIAGKSKVSGSLWMSLRVGARMGFTLLRELVLRDRFRSR
ncbi:MAG: glycosyltransferase family 2 protein [Gemmatimonadales bacterium]|nr:MAG: glycosyltransferase family 2 protein [Gemmatimonadales bacterium]